MEKPLRTVTLVIVAYLVCWGLVMIAFPLKPFWRDEWCLLYNLKFMSPAELWGPLDFTQQFPRVYLQLIKWFTSALHYSYASVRFPSFIAGTASLFLAYRLKDRLFGSNVARWLFVVIIAGNPMFIDYYVQIKHYEMEVLMGLVAIWQLIEVLELIDGKEPGWPRYALLCISFFAAPFFSYTYPIAVAPVLLTILLTSASHYKTTNKIPRHFILPMLAAIAGNLLFYYIDVAQVMSDSNMNGYWRYRLAKGHGALVARMLQVWCYFAKTGAGFVFELVFGITGICAFLHSARHLARRGRIEKTDRAVWIRLYAAALTLLLIILGVTGKLPLGEAKFTAFAAPAMGILLVYVVTHLLHASQHPKWARALFLVLFAAMAGNVLTAFLPVFTSQEVRKRIAIYSTTESALQLARQKKIPILVTPGIGYPDNITAHIQFLSMPSAAGILKTFPSYYVQDTIPAYSIDSIASITNYRYLLPDSAQRVIVGDGLNYTEIEVPVR